MVSKSWLIRLITYYGMDIINKKIILKNNIHKCQIIKLKTYLGYFAQNSFYIYLYTFFCFHKDHQQETGGRTVCLYLHQDQNHRTVVQEHDCWFESILFLQNQEEKELDGFLLELLSSCGTKELQECVGLVQQTANCG